MKKLSLQLAVQSAVSQVLLLSLGGCHGEPRPKTGPPEPERPTQPQTPPPALEQPTSAVEPRQDHPPSIPLAVDDKQPVDPPPTSPEPSGTAINYCGSQATAFNRMNLTKKYDYIAVHRALHERLDRVGPHGAKSDDPSTIRIATNELLSGNWRACGQMGCTQIAVVTVLDGKAEIFDGSSVKELLGHIDTPHEAQLLAQASGHQIHCDNLPARVGENFEVTFQQRISDCPIQNKTVQLEIRPDSSLRVIAEKEQPPTGVCVGRRPEGLGEIEVSSQGGDLGKHFAHMCALERAAVFAFELMERELASWGAPEALISRARQAAEEEVRHSQLVARLADRFGAAAAPPSVEEPKPRDLLSFALENAEEGCVRETFGAAAALLHAKQCDDPEIRDIMKEIAIDELNHAQLSQDVHSWALRQLNESQVKEVEQRLRDARAQLRWDVKNSPEWGQRTGYPSREQCASLLEYLEKDVWAA